MNTVHLLPAPLHIPQGIIPKHSTRPQSRDRAAKPQPPRKEVPKREEERKMVTRSGEREGKKTIPVSPPTTSPFEETKHFEDKLRKAMELSKKEKKKGDEEELQLLKKVLKESLHEEIKKSLKKTSTSSNHLRWMQLNCF